MTDVFVLGALHLDVVVDAPRLPALDETLIGDAVAYRFGGKGGNQALAAARMGARVAMAGRVGRDAFAEIVMGSLAASGVDHSQVRQVEGATGMSVAIVEQAGEYGAVVVSGVNQSIHPDDVDIGDARVLVLQNEIPEAVNLEVVQGRTAGTTVLLNAAPARATAAAVLQAVDVLIVNRMEAAQLTGVDPDGLDLAQAATSLKRLGPRAVIVTSGAEGLAVTDADGLDIIPAPKRVTGSAHGAGDAFVGALAAEIAQGAPLRAAAQFAAAAAAYHVLTPPDAREQITRGDVQDWVQTK